MAGFYEIQCATHHLSLLIRVFLNEFMKYLCYYQLKKILLHSFFPSSQIYIYITCIISPPQNFVEQKWRSKSTNVCRADLFCFVYPTRLLIVNHARIQHISVINQMIPSCPTNPGFHNMWDIINMVTWHLSSCNSGTGISRKKSKFFPEALLTWTSMAVMCEATTNEPNMLMNAIKSDGVGQTKNTKNAVALQ